MQFEKSLPEETDLKLVESVQRNTYRYIDVLSQAVDAIMPKETKEMTYVDIPKARNLEESLANPKQVQRRCP